MVLQCVMCVHVSSGQSVCKEAGTRRETDRRLRWGETEVDGGSREFPANLRQFAGRRTRVGGICCLPWTVHAGIPGTVCH